MIRGITALEYWIKNFSCSCRHVGRNKTNADRGSFVIRSRMAALQCKSLPYNFGILRAFGNLVN